MLLGPRCQKPALTLGRNHTVQLVGQSLHQRCVVHGDNKPSCPPSTVNALHGSSGLHLSSKSGSASATKLAAIQAGSDPTKVWASVPNSSNHYCGVSTHHGQSGSFHSRFLLGHALGKGSFATVHLATSVDTYQQWAVKVLPKTTGKAAAWNMSAISTEVDVWTSAQQCEHVAQLEGIYEDDASVYIVQELCAGGDLKALLQEHGMLSEQETACLVKAVLSAVAVCHDTGYSYGDIKPANLLLKHKYPSAAEREAQAANGSIVCNELVVKLVDFGCSQKACSQGFVARRTGTPLYTAPEVFQGRHGLPADIWGVGVLMYQALTGQFPFWDQDLASLQKKAPHDVVAGIIYNEMGLGSRYASRHLTPEALDLLRSMLQRDPKQRITAAAALSHPWLKQHCSRDAAPVAVQETTGKACFAANNVVAIPPSLAAATHQKATQQKAMAASVL